MMNNDNDILARTLWGEARGEGLAGMVAVAWSIRNRVEDGKDKSWWGEGYTGVCQKPYQFSCWNKDDPNQPYLTGAKQIPFRELAQCRVAADQVIDGKVADPTNGATHYYATTMPKPPTWAAKGHADAEARAPHLFQGRAMSPAAALYLKIGGALAVLLIIAAILFGAYHHGESVADARWQLKWADQQMLQAKGLAAATTANRTEEQRRQTAVNQVENDARQQQAVASADALSADAAGDRVREQAGKLAASASCTSGDPGTTERSKTATRAAMVLSDLFQRADKRAGELAKAYDAARIAGLACEASYASLAEAGTVIK